MKSRRKLSRRSCLRRIAIGCAAAVTPTFLRVPSSEAAEGQAKPTSTERAALAEIAQKFIGDHQIPGLSVAIARHGEMVYAEGFGLADKSSGECVTPNHRFRICSVTKPITSTAIHLLIEQNKLKTDDLVFGPKGILGSDFPNLRQPHLEEITIHHLLTHTAGGWTNNGNDPMFSHARMNHHELIAWTLSNRPLENPPGAHYAYSNFGYCVLGRVLEKVGGHPYESFVRENIFQKCGNEQTQLGGNTLGERAKNEVVYYSDGNGAPYGMNVRRMDSHGGWISTPSDIVRFATHVDGFQTTPNILKRETIKVMTTGTEANGGYASGWCVNKTPNWWHDGSLPGS
ncbi:MAG TPA: serine hydrolase domain-containing protein, partial [Candidatus Dormibacteraeota bacterium]|nr:serine hydrolase domain-containing protein [Candidatus Dormibacteraeota bacterium]